MWSEVHCHLVAPRAYAPSLIVPGMDRIDSRVATMMMGRMSRARVRPADRMLCPKPNF